MSEEVESRSGVQRCILLEEMSQARPELSRSARAFSMSGMLYRRKVPYVIARRAGKAPATPAPGCPSFDGACPRAETDEKRCSCRSARLAASLFRCLLANWAAGPDPLYFLGL